MRERLEQLGWTLARVEEATEDSYKNVQRWIRGTTAVPGEFVARFVAAVPVNPWWLLMEEGSPEPLEPGRVERAFDEIARIVDEARAAPGPEVEPEAAAATARLLDDEALLDAAAQMNAEIERRRREREQGEGRQHA